MSLHVLPTRIAGAPENMAVDFLLLPRYPEKAAPRFRHYGWRTPAVTFGYSQKIGFVRQQLRLGEGERLEVCRRPTGGGVVDHRQDWTYALILPRGHPLEELRACESYRLVHETLAATLRAMAVPCRTKPAADSTPAEATPEKAPSTPASVCFERAEVHDVVHDATGAKIAGAAQKRNKHGLLFQGSIWKPAIGPAGIDWEHWAETFPAALAVALGTDAEPVPWPELNEEEVSALTEQYSSPEWNEFR
jgi:lipoate-protein ligase A